MSAERNHRQEIIKALDARAGKLFDSNESELALHSLQEHMVDISGDPHGSDPADYMSPDDVKILEEFVDIASSLDWPGAEPINMLKHRTGRPAWSSTEYSGRSGLVKSVFYRPVRLTPLRGYRLGKLHMPLGQPVAIAEDGKLYSERGSEMTRSYGMGWGVLPDRECLDEVITHGDPIYYGSKLLSKVLADRLAI
jgi:hypothetical protein